MSGYSSLPYNTIAAAAGENQILFSQIYFTTNDTANLELIKSAEASGAKAVVWSVDSPGSPDRQRAARYAVTSANDEFVKNNWDVYDEYKNATSLPLVLKGIQNVQDAKLAVEHGVPAIILSNQHLITYFNI